MRVHTMLAALALVCLGQKAGAYPIQVQTVPKALQGMWVNLADTKQRHAACKSIRQQKAPKKAAYFIAINSAELRHSYRGNESTLLPHELINSRFLPQRLESTRPAFDTREIGTQKHCARIKLPLPCPKPNLEHAPFGSENLLPLPQLNQTGSTNTLSATAASMTKAACKYVQAALKTHSHQSADNTVTTVASLPLLLTLTRVVPP